MNYERLRSVADLAATPSDPSNFPPDIAAVIQGGTATDAPENQPPVMLVRPRQGLKMTLRERVEENKRKAQAARAKQEKKED